MKRPTRTAGAMGPGAMDLIAAKQKVAKQLRAQPTKDKLRGVPSEDGFFAGSLNSAFGFKPTKNQRLQEAAKKLQKETGPLFAKAERDRNAGYRLAAASKVQAKNMALMNVPKPASPKPLHTTTTKPVTKTEPGGTERRRSGGAIKKK